MKRNPTKLADIQCLHTHNRTLINLTLPQQLQTRYEDPQTTLLIRSLLCAISHMIQIITVTMDPCSQLWKMPLQRQDQLVTRRIGVVGPKMDNMMIEDMTKCLLPPH